MKYEILLFDVDNTILDFDKSEEMALRIALESEGLSLDDHSLQVYRRNNIEMWEKLEKQLVTIDQVLMDRFTHTAQELGWNCDIVKVATIYEEELHNGFYTIAGAEELLTKLQQKRYKLYVVSNGAVTIQHARMKGTGFDRFFIKRFISGEVGVPKPQKAFFDICFSQIPNFDKSKALIIGDSLTSDIKGGVNVGVDTVWYNPNGKQNNKDFAPTYEIAVLSDLLQIVE